TPAVGHVEEAAAGDHRAARRRELPEHWRAGGVDPERHVVLRARHLDVTGPIPVEDLRRVVVGLGDEPVQRHAHVSEHVGHALTTRLTPPTHRSTTKARTILNRYEGAGAPPTMLTSQPEHSWRWGESNSCGWHYPLCSTVSRCRRFPESCRTRRDRAGHVVSV